MSGLQTWTVRLDDCCVVVTAEDVDMAAFLIIKNFCVYVNASELIPLPTHHRYARLLRPIKEASE